MQPNSDKYLSYLAVFDGNSLQPNFQTFIGLEGLLGQSYQDNLERKEWQAEKLTTPSDPLY